MGTTEQVKVAGQDGGGTKHTGGYAGLRDSIMANEETSYWMKRAIRDLEKRDPVDAIGDAELLKGLMEMRMEEVLREFRKERVS